MSNNILDWTIEKFYHILPSVSDHKAERALTKNAQIEKEAIYVPPAQPKGMTLKYHPIGSDLTGPKFEEAMSRYGASQEGSQSEKTEARPIKRKKESKGSKEKKQKK